MSKRYRSIEHWYFDYQMRRVGPVQATAIAWMFAVQLGILAACLVGLAVWGTR